MPNTTFDFLPLSICIDTLGGLATPLILRGTPLPATRSDEFSTASDNQESVEVKLLMGERPLTESNALLGTFHLSGLPAAKKGEPKICVEFSVDKRCFVKARASLKGGVMFAEQTFPPPNGMGSDFVKVKLAEAENNRLADEAERQRIEAVNQARSKIGEAEQQLEKSSNAALNKSIAELGLALESGDTDDIKRRTATLDAQLQRIRTVNTENLFGGFDFSSLFDTPKPVVSRPAVSKPRVQPKPTSAKPAKEALTPTPAQRQLGKIFGSGEFSLDPQLCFVLMPFAKDLQPLYDDHLRPTIERAGLRCERADEIRGTTAITTDIWERTNRARFLVADLTNQNANVFYELGLAHALGKDVILITQSMEFVPFDLKTIRCIVYDFKPRGMKELEEKLAKTLDVLMKSA